MIKNHRKSLSELTSMAPANFYFSLKKNTKIELERLPF